VRCSKTEEGVAWSRSGKGMSDDKDCMLAVSAKCGVSLARSAASVGKGQKAKGERIVCKLQPLLWRGDDGPSTYVHLDSNSKLMRLLASMKL